MSVAENLTVIRPPTLLGGVIAKRAEARLTDRWIEDLRVLPQRRHARIGELSGGNQQKVLIARVLQAGADVLLIDEPGNGVDIHGKEQVRLILEAAVDAGRAVLLSSSDPEELLSMSTRVLVLRQGRIAGELDPSDATERDVIALATGVALPRVLEGMQDA
jgi:ABC-type sugar transport system ATPase subunit